MSFLIVSSQRDPKAWVQALKEQDPDLDLEVFPEVADPSKVEFALSWKHPHGIYKNYPNLKAIASMGAGIDHIINDPDIPQHIKITRVIDEQLTKDMSVFVLSLILDHLRNLSHHYCSKEWKPVKYLRPEEVQVGIMGMGVLAVGVAEKLIRNKFNVTGWSRSQKEILGVTTFHGDDQLQDFLEQSNVLLCLLPLTSETENILNKRLFERLPQGAYVINVARGPHLVEEDLLEMIDSGHLSGASLDVFRKEPLPEDHPFWKHEKIRITPHIASVTNPSTVVPQILENYERIKQGKELNNVVDREKEY
ncbi:glyoxylate/hydroxypyruvate reductase A [Salinimicrobium sediminis]|uniref:Glyoxylate/hydroxypyruvate reductase A n=1 Tax=Salinimicrobium sediminis TaxID=1343891 RepID=A0A285X0A5_9FLAO|nr:glyoxylate/hydroxypyruvate reductase A [Salinimicrobium sediminis]SOC78800.1 glyoxylate/hydroxypyruvate reductase A [Salinimicrobium sediminis]